MNTSWEVCGNTTLNTIITNATWTLCQTAADLARSNRLIITIAFRAAVSIIGIVLFVLLFKVQGTYMAFHGNARILMISHHFWAIATSLSNLLAITATFIRIAPNHVCPCDYLTTVFSSIFTRVWIGLCIYGQVYMFVVMTIERIVATARYRTYERTKKTLGICLIAVQVLLSAFCTWLPLGNIDLSELKAYGSTSSSNSSTLTGDIYKILIGVEVLCLASFYGLFSLNKRYKSNSGEESLTEKYQIDENIRAIHLMMPMVLTHFCIFAPAMMALPIYTTYISPHFDFKDYTITSETCNITYMYSAILPVVLFWRHKALRENLRKAMKINEILPEGTRLDGRTREQARHFQILQQLWLSPNN